MSGELLIFGGTSEGAELARLLPQWGYQVTVSVATDYGSLML
ncbi:MAG: precorrin-6A/cobalt-precorrin-6A reductase, partial [Clostridiales bacterium]|nr:precorrin-6A/cobalt-precorrin-6A reductase [Clostridiales bacterium]